MAWKRSLLLFSSVVVTVFAGGLQGCGDDDNAGPNPNGDGGEGGTVGEGGPDGGFVRRPSTLPSHGSTIAISPDDARIVVANRESGTVSTFNVDWASGRPALTKSGEVAVGNEVSQVVIHPSGTFALALSRINQTITKIDNLAGTPTAGATLKTGSEPTGLALTPFGDKAWIANWVDGTVQVVDTATMQESTKVDLNNVIAASGRLGTVAGRPALAHPRSIAITNNGNNIDDDEFAYVTEFYAHQKVELASNGSNADTAKTAVVYKISVKNPAEPVTLIELPPMQDMGFKDHKNETAGCFPNQLLNINIQGSFAYVLSICASPKGPIGPFTGPAGPVCTTDANCPGQVVGSCTGTPTLRCTTNCTMDAECGANGGKCNNNICAGNLANVKTTVAPAVTILDLGDGSAIGTVNLAKEFENNFAARTPPIADDGNRRFPLTPTDIGFVPGTVTAYVTGKGSDALFKIDFNATYEATTIDGVGAPNAPFIQLAPAGIDASLTGRLPTGVAVAFKEHTAGSKLRFAFVTNENTRNVSVVDLDAQDLAGRSEGVPVVAQSTALPTDAEGLARLEGSRLFSTGLGRWSMKGQAWAACESCHIDGLSDNVTWFFPRGARQPNSLDGTFDSKNPGDSRFHNWGAIQDEVADHEMGAIRGTMGGVGAIVTNGALDPANRIAIDRIGHAGLAGSATKAADPSNPLALTQACVIDDWQKLTKHFQSIRSTKRPSNLNPDAVNAGKALYEAGNCQGCHAGPKWTLSKVFYQPNEPTTIGGALRSLSWNTALSATSFPASLYPASNVANRNMRYNGADNPNFDQMVCALRPVGTFGVAEPGVGIAELRRDMVTAGQGNETDGKGYNIPSLLSMSVGAPYFHAGQVRTLEALLATPFEAHLQALKAGFLGAAEPDRAAKIAQLVQYILAIDEDTPPIAEPTVGANGGWFCAPPP
jgi:DNA-binding beta-propeller fold protein YncE